jgi:chemotaxis protein MotB
MARKKDAGHGGGHGWFVTFADLMGLLVAFFVMLVAFSNQDQQKLQIVAGSMRDASATPTPDEHDRQRTSGARLKEDRAFALAAASLRQALQDMPELTEISKHIVIEESKDGLNIEIVDQDGRSMFPEGSKEPYERTRRVVEKLSAPLKSTPYRLSVTGHTAATKTPPRPGYGPWELSADRANAVRRILEEQGLPTAQFMQVAGKSDTQPLFPDDPFIAANRRVTITLMREEPPLPTDFQP